jgi:hypothetical protein
MRSLFDWFDPALYPWLGVPAFYLLFLLLDSRISGWFTLADRFRKISEPVGETRTGGSFADTVILRRHGKFAVFIRLTAASDALYLSVFFLFRLGHPPLRVPWSEIAFSRNQYFLKDEIVLILGKQEQIPLLVSTGTAAKLGILDRVPGDLPTDTELNFDKLPDDFMNSSAKKSD